MYIYIYVYTYMYLICLYNSLVSKFREVYMGLYDMFGVCMSIDRVRSKRSKVYVAH